MVVRLGDGIAVSFSDITDRKQYERQLAYQAFILDNVSDAIYVIDLDFNITLWNQGAEALYGWQAEEVIGRRAVEVVHTISTAELRAARIDAVEAGEKRSFEVVHHNRRGVQVYVDSVASALRDSDGNIIGYAVINHDMTERKRHEQELVRINASLEERIRARTAELERSNRELDRFAYVASHDLKAPLRAVANLAKWIDEDGAAALPPSSRQHLAKLHGRIKRMETLLDDLLAYSRAGRVRHQPELVDPQLLVQETVEFLNLPSTFVVDVTAHLPVIYTERVPLETVFRNLIQNAYKHHHHPDGGCVRISAEELAEAVVFKVADDGPGIDPQYHERIFDIFQTLKPRDQVEGSGIGLTVVKKIVESRGGSLRLESAVGAGATFLITWPKSDATRNNEAAGYLPVPGA
jgi:PAS domain S-box-containing protein